MSAKLTHADKRAMGFGQQARVSFGSRTDVGLVREQNEDSLIVRPPLYVVCDGMGGHEAGEIASEIAVNVISGSAPEYPDASELGQAVEEANLAIMRAAAEGVGRVGMGTTCTAAMLQGERLVVAQVGDSRAYLLHDGNIQQLTRDHSLVADLVEAGHITPEEARFHPQRSVITRALGSDPHMRPDLYEINVQTDDRLLLCSDGLYSMVDDYTIEGILEAHEDPQQAAEELVAAALKAGGHDNVTVIVVDVTGFAEVRRKKMARKTKVTAVVVVVLLIAILSGAGITLSYFMNNYAYLGEVDGRVAVYKGIPGDLLGQQFGDIQEVTDVALEDLMPGVANRIRNNEIRRDSLDAAYALVDEYRSEIAERGITAGKSSDGILEDGSNSASSGSASSAGADGAAATGGTSGDGGSAAGSSSAGAGA